LPGSVELTGFADADDVLVLSSLSVLALLCVAAEVSSLSSACAAELCPADGADEFGCADEFAAVAAEPLEDEPLFAAGADWPCGAWFGLLATGELMLCKIDEKPWLGELLGDVDPLAVGDGAGLTLVIETFMNRAAYGEALLTCRIDNSKAGATAAAAANSRKAFDYFCGEAAWPGLRQRPWGNSCRTRSAFLAERARGE